MCGNLVLHLRKTGLRAPHSSQTWLGCPDSRGPPLLGCSSSPFTSLLSYPPVLNEAEDFLAQFYLTESCGCLWGCLLWWIFFPTGDTKVRASTLES